MGTKERLEILVGTQSKGKIQEIINDSLKRISNLEFEVERLTELCDKYEEEHRTTFEEWKKTINIINELEKWLKEEYEATVFDYHFAIEDILNKLQELKGSDK